ncbi:MAG TPA: glycoside hydrolase family 99-like domain-containing protein [Terriglobales bacterium]|nr:glycoside hydrolase family 99-like domain-containing protein [Terriglobales bacterium]
MKNLPSRIAAMMLLAPCVFLYLEISPAQTSPSALTATPTIKALSHNSRDDDGAAFTLSVVGSNFQSNSTVQVNGKALKTTFLGDKLLTAEVPGNSVRKTSDVTVLNPPKAVSNAMRIAVPCQIVASSSVPEEKRARVGVYYFDGWAGPMNKPGFDEALLQQFGEREPLSGWQDDSACALNQQLAWAHDFGIDFFIFDWYFNPEKNAPGQNLNSAFNLTRSLPDRHGMQYALMYVNHGPFVMSPDDWSTTINEWVGYMGGSGYARINGKPLLVIYDVEMMRKTFGSSAAVAKALKQLRAAATARGLPGVYIAGGFHPGYDLSSVRHSIPDLAPTANEGYDALTMYGYSVGGRTGEQKFSVLSDVGKWIWGQVAEKSPLPFIPVVRDGWDERPDKSGGLWYARTPDELAKFVKEAIAWADAHPKLRPEPPPNPPMIWIEAWNELGEGSYLVPTVTDGTSYGDAVRKILVP